jgi:hypothetical protein
VDIDSVGTIIYWCEGSKRERDYRVEFVNSDPVMIKVFMKYLRSRGIQESRIRARISLHEQDSISEYQDYWKGVTSLDDSNFLTASVRRTKTTKALLPHGTLTIRYNSIALLRQIKRDIANLASELLQT